MQMSTNANWVHQTVIQHQKTVLTTLAVTGVNAKMASLICLECAKVSKFDHRFSDCVMKAYNVEFL